MSGIRCENTGCRGNAPCESCLTGLQIAVWKGLQDSFGIAEKKPEAAVIKHFMDHIKRTLSFYWANVASGKEAKPSMLTNRPMTIRELAERENEVTLTLEKKTGKKRRR